MGNSRPIDGEVMDHNSQRFIATRFITICRRNSMGNNYHPCIYIHWIHQGIQSIVRIDFLTCLVIQWMMCCYATDILHSLSMHGVTSKWMIPLLNIIILGGLADGVRRHVRLHACKSRAQRFRIPR